MTYSVATGPSGSGWATMIVGVLLFVGLSFAGYTRLFRGGHRRRVRTDRPGHRSAQQMLADRFTRGEITESEYRHISAALHRGQPPRRRRHSHAATARRRT